MPGSLIVAMVKHISSFRVWLETVGHYCVDVVVHIRYQIRDPLFGLILQSVFLAACGKKL